MKSSLAMRVMAVVMMLSSCGGEPVDEFREAAPSSLGISIAIKKGKGDALIGDPALMPGVTGVAAFLVNGSVALVLGTVGAVVSTEPKSISSTEAEWGPTSRPLWKDEFTLSMKRSGSEFTYVGQGRPRAGGTFTTIITGKHKLTATGSEGSFKLDYDGMQSLSSPPLTVGHAVVNYTRTRKGDLTLAIDFVQTGLPRSTVRHDSKYTFSQIEGGAGHLEFVIDSNYVAKTSADERLSIKSRWNWDGSGRADVVGSKGDLVTPIQFTECWDTAHARTFYGDSLQLFPTEGVEADCKFTSAAYSTL